MAHPVRPDSYHRDQQLLHRDRLQKGAEVVPHAADRCSGATGSGEGMDLYFERHDGQAVTVDDFVPAIGDANKTDLTQFKRWYNQAGTPGLDARLSYSQGTKSARLTLSQSYPAMPEGAKRKPVPIPVRLGLLGGKGEDLPLNENGKPLRDGLVMLRKKKEVFTFEDVGERPVLSVLRDFSAPVKLNASASDREMLTLIRSDSDPFNRWQTAQGFALKHIADMAKAIAGGSEPRVNARFVQAVGAVADDDSLEHAYRAAFLALPSESDVAQAIGENVDPEAIHIARENLRSAFGRSLRSILEGVYERSAPDEPYRPDAESVGETRACQACSRSPGGRQEPLRHCESQGAGSDGDEHDRGHRRAVDSVHRRRGSLRSRRSSASTGVGKTRPL